MRTRWMFVPLLSCATVAAAQSPSPRIGLFAGLNQSHIAGSGVSDISNHAAGVFGAYYAAPLSGDWRLQSGVIFTMKGWERDEPVTHDLAVAKFNYIEIPVLLRYDIAAAERVGGFLYGGPGFAFRTSCDLVGTEHSTGLSASTSCTNFRTSSNEEGFKKFDAGAIIGGGLRLAAGREQVVLTAQYEHGLTKISSLTDAKNRALTFGVGLEIPFRLK